MIDHKTDPADDYHTKAKKNDHDWSKVVPEAGGAYQIVTDANDASTKCKKTNGGLREGNFDKIPPG
jgi:hypothetical protein